MREAIGVVASELDIEVQQRGKTIPGASSLSKMETDWGRCAEATRDTRALGSTPSTPPGQEATAHLQGLPPVPQGRRGGEEEGLVAVLAPANLSHSFFPMGPQYLSSQKLEQGRCSLGAAGPSSSQDPMSLPLSQISALGNWKHM